MALKVVYIVALQPDAKNKCKLTEKIQYFLRRLIKCVGVIQIISNLCIFQINREALFCKPHKILEYNLSQFSSNSVVKGPNQRPRFREALTKCKNMIGWPPFFSQFHWRIMNFRVLNGSNYHAFMYLSNRHDLSTERF